MRLLTAVAVLAPGRSVLTGTPRMSQRPLQGLLDALAQCGASVRSQRANGCPPVEIVGAGFKGGSVELDCHVSSQFLSALLLIGPYGSEALLIDVTRGPVSRPYIDMTLAVMARMGVAVHREGYRRFSVSGGGRYRGGEQVVEADCSQAGYFWAAAAIDGARILVKGIRRDSLQGDVRFVDVLARMGCRVTEAPDGLTVRGGPLRGVTVDMGHMPDLVPTLAVVAAHADGTTVMHNIAHLRAKESDRLAATAAELAKMGIETRATAETLTVRGGCPHGAVIDTYDDHRMAMSFALAGLRTPGVLIRGEQCVEKSFPEFWKVFNALQ
jgi:3-phosphoshikimate 1-carboxyvinyltransferase